MSESLGNVGKYVRLIAGKSFSFHSEQQISRLYLPLVLTSIAPLDSYIAADRPPREGRQWGKAFCCSNCRIEFCLPFSYGTLTLLGHKKMLSENCVHYTQHSTIHCLSSTPSIPRSSSLRSWSHNKGRLCQHPRQIPWVPPHLLPNKRLNLYRDPQESHRPRPWPPRLRRASSDWKAPPRRPLLAWHHRSPQSQQH